MNLPLIRWLVLACLVAGLCPSRAPAAASAATEAWNVAVLDRLLASVPAGQTSAQVGDMIIPVAYLQSWRTKLAGGPQPQTAFDGTFAKWTGGNVYYAFSNNVSTVKQKAFLDGAAEWATFANLHFIPRTNQTNYVTVYEATGQEGGQSMVGMVGGQQFLSIGPTSWNRATICHELGHTLGLVHEHQRSDRNSYVTILTNNITPGDEGNFVLLTDSQNQSAYDFLSIMHYSRNLQSIDPSLDTIEPLPAYAQYLNLMGQADPVLSASDRAGMAAIYGAGQGATNRVANTQDSGPGSLRAALYYAYDHPGTTITFNIPVTDTGYSNSVFNILPSDNFPSLVNATVLDGRSEPTNSNPNGPAVLLNGVLGPALSVYSSGLQFKGTNCMARALTINNFSNCGVLFDGSNTVGNTVSGCYLGIDPTGTLAVTNGNCPIQISGGAVSNLVGGTTAAARNIISGSAHQGIVMRDAGTCFNTVSGNYLGLNAAGTAALPNAWSGIEIFGGAQSNLIGGFTATAGNVISGNALQGVLLSDLGTSGNTVAGNYLGLNPAGTAAVSNGWSGVEISGDAFANCVGPSNVISGNGNHGVLMNATAQNVVRNNFIGLNAAGAAAVGNTWAGVQLYYGPQCNTITGNVISGNGNDGVMLAGTTTTGNVLAGNLIGLNAAGTTAVANAWRGVDLYNGAATNMVGGLGDARNFISGNALDGVYIAFDSDGNVVQGNTIGLDTRNTTPIPNGNAGVLLYENSAANLIGGVTLGAANLISGNSADGVQAGYSATNNPIRGNSIFDNAGAGIVLYVGGNNELAAPVLTSAVVTTNTVVSGSYTGVLGNLYLLDFYADANAQAMTYLGSISVTGTGGPAAFVANLGAHLPAGRAVTATATDPAGNTSQLAIGVAATMTSTPNDGIPDAWRALYFGGNGTTTNNQSASFADPDHDGFSNYQEFLAGTNPTNAASVLQLTALNPNTAANVVSLNSVNGIVYRLLYRDDIADGIWNILADQVIGTGTNIFLPDPAAPSLVKRFYRAQVLW